MSSWSCPPSPARSVRSFRSHRSERSDEEASYKKLYQDEIEDRRRVEEEAVRKLQQIKRQYDERLLEKDQEIGRLKKMIDCNVRSTFEFNVEGEFDGINRKRDTDIQAKDLEIDRLKERCKYTREINLELRTKINDLEKQLKTGNDDIQQELEKKNAELDKRIQETKNLRSICTQLESQMDQYDSLLTAKTDAFNQLSVEKSRIEAENVSLKQELENLKFELSSEFEKKDRKINDLNAQLSQLEAVIAEEKTRIQSLTKELEEQRKTSSNDKQKISSLEELLTYSNNQNCTFEDLVAELTNENVRIKEEAARHISELMQKDSELAESENKLENSRRTVQEIRARYESLQKAVEEERRFYETEIFRLTERLRQHFGLEQTMLERIDKLEKAKKPFIAFSPNPRKFLRSRVYEEEEGDETRKLREELIKTETELLNMKGQLRDVHKLNAMNGREDRHRSRDPTAPLESDLEDGEAFDESRLSTDENELSGERIRYAQILHSSGPSHTAMQQFAFMDSVIDELDRKYKRVDSHVLT